MSSARVSCLAAVLALAAADAGLARADPCTIGWQPGFDTAGTNGAIYAMTIFDDGSGPALYAAGSFTSIGGTPANSIAKWDGQSWSALGDGIPENVFSLTVFDDDGSGPDPAVLVASGEFDEAGGLPAGSIAQWDGQAWTALGGGFNAECFVVAVFDDGSGPALYAGGEFHEADGAPCAHIARWDGKHWSEVGGGLLADGAVLGAAFAMVPFDDGTGPALFVGGSFNHAGSTTASFVAKWNGSTWAPLGSGMNYKVHCLGVYDDGGGPALYAGGEFTSAGGGPARGIAKWNGISWSALGAGISGGFQAAPFAMAAYDQDGPGPGGPALFVGGLFTRAGGTPASRIARWDGSIWSTLESGIDNSVNALVVLQNGANPGLYAGGTFSIAGGLASHSVALWAASGAPPEILQEPAAAATCAGGTAGFSATASGGDLAYRWRKNGQDLNDGGSVSGANSPALLISPTVPGDAGSYDVIISSACGDTPSQPATLSVFPGGGGDGNGDSAANGLDAQGFVDAVLGGGPPSASYCVYDMDGDGVVGESDVPIFVDALVNAP